MNRPFHGGNLIKASVKYKIEIDKIIDFSANINPLGISPKVRNALNIALVPCYPDPYCDGLRSEIAAYLEIDKENILVGNGSCDLIYLIPRVFKPQKVLILIPTFSEYEYAVKIIGGECNFLRLSNDNSFFLKPESILKHFSGIDMVFICNPNNPTGSIISKEDLLFIIDACKKKKIKVVIDEAFIDFIEDYEHFSLIREATLKENVLVLRSLTKFFGLAGLRVGYLVGESRSVKELAKHHAPWTVNALGQIAAKEALKDQKFIEETRSYIKQEKKYLLDRLKEIEGIEPYPSAANFIFCRLVENGINSSLLSEELGYQGILIRDCKSFKGLDDRFIRVAVRKREENLKLISALDKIYKKRY